MPATAPAARPRPKRPKGTFRIVFEIEATPYEVVPLKPDPAVATRAYRVIKRDAQGKVAATYDVSLSAEGYLACECKGFLRWQRPCRHMRCLSAAGMLPALPPLAVPKPPTPEPESEGGDDGTQATA
jgi:hypothetical protein